MTARRLSNFRLVSHSLNFPRALLAAGAALLATGCGECIGSPPSYCEGDIWVHCVGGWMNGFALHPERTDCRAKGKRCTGPQQIGAGASCKTPLGTCDLTTFRSYCEPYDSASDTGLMTKCVNGEVLPIGESCGNGFRIPL